jgi:hypothetical protein
VNLGIVPLIALVRNGIIGAVPVVDLAKDTHALVENPLDIVGVQNIVGLLCMNGYLRAWG